MPVPIARPVSLPSEEHARLESLVRAHSTPQALAFRCRLILRTAAPDRPSNLQVATEMACERHTVGRWRQRYLAHGLSVAHIAQQYRESVTPEAGHGIALLRAGLEPVRDDGQQLIAGAVAQGVVDALEVIQIHVHERAACEP